MLKVGTPGTSAKTIPPRMNAAAGGKRKRRAINSKTRMATKRNTRNSYCDEADISGASIRLRSLGANFAQGSQVAAVTHPTAACAIN